MALTPLWTPQMTPEDQTYYQALGQRVAAARKAQGFTQQQVAEHLGISQKTLAHYEVGRLRIAVATLQSLATLLHCTVDDLLATKAAKTNKRGPASKLQQQVEQVRQMPRSKQKFISEMLDALIKQQQQAG